MENRIGLGRGFASKIITGDLVPVASITTEPAGTNIEAGNRVDPAASGHLTHWYDHRTQQPPNADRPSD